MTTQTNGLRTAEAARLLGVGSVEVLRLVDAGTLAAYKDPRGLLRIPREALDTYAAGSRGSR